MTTTLVQPFSKSFLAVQQMSEKFKEYILHHEGMNWAVHPHLMIGEKGDNLATGPKETNVPILRILTPLVQSLTLPPWSVFKLNLRYAKERVRELKERSRKDLGDSYMRRIRVYIELSRSFDNFISLDLETDEIAEHELFLSSVDLGYLSLILEGMRVKEATVFWQGAKSPIYFITPNRHALLAPVVQRLSRYK